MVIQIVLELVSFRYYPTCHYWENISYIFIFVMFLPNSSTTMKYFEKKKIIFAFFGIFFRSLKSILITGLLGLIFLFIVIPSIFRWSTVVQRQMVFLPWGKHISLLNKAPNQLGSWVHYPKESKHFFLNCFVCTLL